VTSFGLKYALLYICLSRWRHARASASSAPERDYSTVLRYSLPVEETRPRSCASGWSRTGTSMRNFAWNLAATWASARPKWRCALCFLARAWRQAASLFGVLCAHYPALRHAQHLNSFREPFARVGQSQVEGHVALQIDQGNQALPAEDLAAGRSISCRHAPQLLQGVFTSSRTGPKDVISVR